jgi:hypothetical protein
LRDIGASKRQVVDGRDKPGHDAGNAAAVMPEGHRQSLPSAGEGVAAGDGWGVVIPALTAVMPALGAGIHDFRERWCEQKASRGWPGQARP